MVGGIALLILKVREFVAKLDIIKEKNYDSLNRYLDGFTGFPPNVSYLWSRWLGLESNNKHDVPEAHVLYDDGATTAPEFGSYLCTGNCSECHIEGKGCWSLGRGESVTFQAH